MVTIVALSIASQSLTALTDPAPGEARNLWNLAPAAMAGVALAMAWRRTSGIPYAVLLLFAATGVSVFTMFGDTAFSHTMLAVMAGVLALLLAWVWLALPVLAWRRGRWPTDVIEYVAYTAEAPDAEALRARREALVAQGFAPRLVLARGERGVSVTIVVFSHLASDVYASLRRIAVPGAAIASTQVFSRPGDGVTLSVSDAVVPSPFPPGPGLEFLVFPDADAATLLANFRRLRPGTESSAPLSDDALAAAMRQSMERHERYLVEAGYLSATEHDHARRYTLKGAFSATLRPRWPWLAIIRSRFERDGEAAMRKAPGASGDRGP
ncbi:MAG: hypothetical protein U1F54_09535 [Burkholderiales bacterium]